MSNLLGKIFDIFLFINKKILEKKYHVKLDSKTSCTVGSTKKFYLGDESLEITSETLKNRDKANDKIAQIVKKNIKTPEKKISVKFKTPAMFVLRDLPVDVYYMSHQFYKWFGYKMKLPGYDYKTQENFKSSFKTLSNNDISKLSRLEKIFIFLLTF